MNHTRLIFGILFIPCILLTNPVTWGEYFKACGCAPLSVLNKSLICCTASAALFMPVGLGLRECGCVKSGLACYAGGAACAGCAFCCQKVVDARERMEMRRH